METTTLFRVEHRSVRPRVTDHRTYETKFPNIRVNRGFFSYYPDLEDEDYTEWNYPQRMPTPYDDGLREIENEHEFFAFKSIEELKEAFPQATLDLLPKYDMVIRKYVVTKVRHGYSQSVFDYRSIQYRRIVKVD